MATRKQIDAKAAELGVTIEDCPASDGGSIDLLAPKAHHFVGTDNHTLCEAYGFFAGPKQDAWRSVWAHLQDGVEPCTPPAGDEPPFSECDAAGCFTA